MEHIISKSDATIWEFPKFPNTEDSITKFDYITCYEDHHGAGNLYDATSFSFTLDNEDIWILPSDSYLKIEFELRQRDGTEYLWADRLAIAADAANNIIAQPAQNAHNVSLSDNGYNLFEEARYFIGEQEVERLDYVGITTILKKLITTHSKFHHDANKHTQFWLSETERQAYIRENRGNIHLLLPLYMLFPFCEQNNHVFRGMKHRLELKLNDANRIVKRAAGVPDGLVRIKTMQWIIPYVEPTLAMMSKLESQMERSREWKLTWKAINVFKHQPQLHTDIRLSLASTIHRPTNIFVALQTANKFSNQENDYMTFDHMSLEQCYVEINSMRYPDKPLTGNFGRNDYSEIFTRFLDACQEKTSILTYPTFKNTYPFIHIDVSQHADSLYDTTSFPTINLYLKFNQQPAEDFIVWVVVLNEREARLNIDSKKMMVIR